MCAVESVKRKLNFDEPRISRKKTEVTQSRRRLDFGESDSVVLQNCPDLLPNRTDPAPVTGPLSPPWSKTDRIIFTVEHKWQLEALFRQKMFPSRAEKTALAERLGVPLEKVMTWFNNRRHRWRKEMRKGLVEPSGYRPTLPGSSMNPTSYQRYLQGKVGFNRPTGFPSTPYPVRLPLPPASNLISRPLPPMQIPWQQVYPPFPAASVGQVPLQHPDTRYQYSAASLYPGHHSMPVRNPVSNPPEVHQVSAAETKSLADDFPFLHSVAKSLPHIFGNLDEDNDQERPLTPSLEPSTELESICDSISLASDQSEETSSESSFGSLIIDESADDACIQPGAYNSCCFGNDSDFSRGFVSNGRTFRFCRQD